MGKLVEGGGSLVLGVALVAEWWEIAIVDWAVEDLVLRWESVGEDTFLAATHGVGAVVGSATTGGGARLLSNGLETALDGLHVLRVLEVFHVLVLVLADGLGRHAGKLSRGFEGSSQSLQLLAVAAGLHVDAGALVDSGERSTLDNAKGILNGGGLLAVDGHVKLVGVVLSSTSDFGAILLGNWDHSLSLEGELAATGKVVGSGNVEGVLNGSLWWEGDEVAWLKILLLICGHHSGKLDLLTIYQNVSIKFPMESSVVSLTLRLNGDLAGWVGVHDGMELQEVQGTVAIVGDGGLDHGVTGRAELDIDHGLADWNTTGDGEAKGWSSKRAEGGESNDDLHVD